MNKLGLGTIGTSWITNSFIEAALETELYELVSVYSRSMEKGKQFASKYGDVDVKDDLEEFVNDENIDVVYIASPNSLHYSQTLIALKAKKHVIVEKPASIDVHQWDEMLEVAKENDVFVFEAAKHLYSPNLEKISKALQDLGEVKGAVFTYIRYSSKYDEVRNGGEPNVFSLNFAGGALMDLGIYPVYTAVALFGEPKNTHYFARKLHTGVDGIGTVILEYETFDLTILVGKTATSKMGVEIYGEEDTLIVDHVSHLGEAVLMNQKSLDETELPLTEQHDNTMIYEAEAFAEMILQPTEKSTIERYSEVSDLARTVTKILYNLRMDADIIFE